MQRVEENDRRTHLDNHHERCQRAILSPTPKPIALATARAGDSERRNGVYPKPFARYSGFIKNDMATGPNLNPTTSFGVYAFENTPAGQDAFLITRAYEAGMIIKGKANLGEMNGFKDQTIRPGWSALGGETVSPYDGKVCLLDR